MGAARKSVRRLPLRTRHLLLEPLEDRQLLCADPQFAGPHELDHDELNSVHSFPGTSAFQVPPAAAGSLNPLSSIPPLNSLPGAVATLYLDFDGHFDATWGGYTNVTTPAFSQDVDKSTFSDLELQAIRDIWAQVSEDFAPFRLNVSTIEPAGFGDGGALRVVIGGDGLWSGGSYGGLAYIDVFTNSITNSVYVFPDHLSGGTTKYVAEASSHEAGHGFGLFHQSEYDANGVKMNEYYGGPGDGRAPIMGVSYYATRGQWWYGTSLSSGTFQEDMSVIGRPANGFGYRSDDHSNTVGSATAVAVVGGQFSAPGIVETPSDVDVFSFETTGGQAELAVRVPKDINNLDARLELRTANGALIATSAPTNSFDATISANLASGSYRLLVTGSGIFGDVGQYTVSGRFGGGPSQPGYLLSLSSSTTLRNSDGSQLAVRAVDIAGLSETSAGYKYQFYLDGSDIGLTTSSEDIDAFDVLADGSILISTLGAYSVRQTYNQPETGSGTTLTGAGEDLLKFTPTAVGSRTTGTWSLLFDGSTAGLSGSAESIDAVAMLDDGRLVVSTSGTAKVSGVTADDEDLMVYDPVRRTWAMYLDGSDVGLGSGSGDIDAMFVEPSSAGGLPSIVLSMRYDFAGPGFNAADEDAFRFTPTKLGGTTSGAFASNLVFDGSKYGLATLDIDGLHIGAAPTAPSTTGLQIAKLSPSGAGSAVGGPSIAASNVMTLNDGASTSEHGRSPLHTLSANSAQTRADTAGSFSVADLAAAQADVPAASAKLINKLRLVDQALSDSGRGTAALTHLRRLLSAKAADAALASLWL